MSTRRPYAFAAALVMGLLSPALCVQADPPSRLVHVHVVGVDGKPAAHRALNLVGLSFFAFEYVNDSRSAHYWDFQTDAQGNASVLIFDFAAWDKDDPKPGWGSYAVVAEGGPHDAGGISTRFWYDNAPSHSGQKPETPPWGEVVSLPPEGLNLSLQLQRGFTLKGRVVDDQHRDQALSGVVITTSIDMHIDTHTGLGGHILSRHTKTNAQGEFAFPHLFPEAVTIEVEEPAIWLDTSLGGTWINSIVSSIDPPESGRPFEMTIGAATTPHFCYSGKVVDDKGRPVGNVDVSFLVMAQSNPEHATWAEEHESQGSTTGPDGTYVFMSPTPWVIRIEAEGAGTVATIGDYRTTYPPGEYDLQLRPPAKKALNPSASKLPPLSPFEFALPPRGTKIPTPAPSP